MKRFLVVLLASLLSFSFLNAKTPEEFALDVSKHIGAFDMEKVLTFFVDPSKTNVSPEIREDIKKHIQELKELINDKEEFAENKASFEGHKDTKILGFGKWAPKPKRNNPYNWLLMEYQQESMVEDSNYDDIFYVKVRLFFKDKYEDMSIYLIEQKKGEWKIVAFG
ncbi:MAG: hypothetical protein GX282_07085 [Campylobacteraceae bacterium]|nr:hypothetical protein [Campylobacteraceae bacterium]